MNRLSPEDCTKAELCAFIRECVDNWNGSAFHTGIFDNFIRAFRSETTYQELDSVSDTLLETIRRYNALLMPYAGKTIKEIPENVLSQARYQAGEINRLKKKRKKLSRKYKKLREDL